MKTIRLLFAGLFLMTLSANAQVSVNVNIGTPPAWGPVGYAETRYYYLPEIEAYYDVPSAMFIYFDGGGWIRAAYLPYRYRHYDLYGAYKVCLHDCGPNPYVYYKHHKVKYHHGYHKGHHQKTYGHRPQVVYNGPRGGYSQERGDYYGNEHYRDHDGNRGERKNEYYRTDYRSSDNNGYYKYDGDHGRGRGNEGNGREKGNGGGRGNGHGNGGGKGHSQRG